MTTERVAWALAHSLWEGAVVALVTVILLKAFSKRPATDRYTLCMLSLFFMVATPVVTLSFYDWFSRLSQTLVGFVARAIDPSVSMHATLDAGGAWTRWVVAVWLIGVVVSVFRILANWRFTRMLVRTASEIVPSEAAAVFEGMKRQFEFPRSVRLMITDRVDGPSAIGWLKPVVLLPVTAITGLTAEQLKAIFAHELAHILRHDFALNVLQRSAESLLFYHPAVWWLSRKIRAEREHCCDDVALQLCGDRLVYAQALVKLEQVRATPSTLAVAAAGSSLPQRVRRVLGRETSRVEWQPAAASSAFVAAVWVIASLWQADSLAATPKGPLPPPPPPLVQAAQAPTLLQVALATLAGPQEANLASVRGIVGKVGSNETLPGTLVELIKVDGGNASRTAKSGSDGAFAFANVEAGEYRLVASRDDGFLPAEYGQRRPNVRGLPFTVSPGQVMKDVRLEMAASGSITGRVLRRDGQPAGRVLIYALKTFYQDSRQATTIAQSVLTNDRGEYRLFWLPPGRYFVLAQRAREDASSVSLYVRPPEQWLGHDQYSAPAVERRPSESGEVIERVDVPTYYPSTPDARSANGIDLRAGENISGIVIRLAEPAPSRRIRGTVINSATGLPASRASVRAVPRDAGASVIVANTTTNNDGVYELSGLVAGSYYLFASPATGSGFVGGGGRSMVDVAAADLQNVSIVMPAGFELAGKFVIEGGKLLDVTKLRADLRRDPEIPGMPFPQPASQPTVPPTADGAFKLSSIGAGEYKLSVSGLPDAAYVKSIRMGPVDILRTGLRLEAPPERELEIVIGSNGGEAYGVVRDEKRAPVANVTVVLVPDLGLRFRMDLYKNVGTSPSGQYQIRGVAPGDYKLFVFDDVEIGSWTDPEFLRNFEVRGTAVHVNEGSRRETELTFVAGR
jgi:beta-lactamase regulating signal transducer with metallopeptidase domain